MAHTLYDELSSVKRNILNQAHSLSDIGILSFDFTDLYKPILDRYSKEYRIKTQISGTDYPFIDCIEIFFY